MKKLHLFLSTVLVMALAAVSCSEEAESYTKGEQDLSSCYRVYFPTQAAAGSHTLDPEADKAITITVARENTSGDITVPVTIIADNPEIFSLSPVTFVDGQSETTATLSFSNYEDAVTYGCTLEIQDNQYASIYDEEPAFLTLDFMVVTWEYLMDETGSNLSTITFTDSQNGETVTANLKYYEVSGTRYCTTYNEVREYGDSAWGEDGGFWGTGEDNHLSFYWYPSMSVYDGYQGIEVPVNVVLDDYVEDGASYGEVEACDYYHYYTDLKGNSLGTFSDFYSKYGASYQVGYYDGRGGFYLYIVYPINTTGYWFGAHWLVGIADGYTRTDYSIVASADLTEDGSVPVTFNLGADVASFKYVVVSGTLKDSEIESLVSDMDSSTDAVTYDNSAAETLVTLGITPNGATGEYTLVAVSYDASGNAQESTSVTFNYLASGDSREVVVSGAIYSPSNKYEAQGYTDETTLEFYVHGSELKEVKAAVFTYAKFVADSATCAESLMKEDSFESDDLASVNESSYSSIFTGLMPGTEYYLLIYATNGYEETVINAGSATTAGDPLPIYQEYTYESEASDLLDATGSSYVGTYNYYAVNAWGSSTLRDYVGKVTIAYLDETKYGARSGYGTAMQISGLSGDSDYTTTYVTDYGYDDAIYVDNYQGYLYLAEAVTADSTMNVYHYAKVSNQFGYGVTYSTYFIPVAEGYYAFVDDGYYYSTYNFCGLGWYNSGWYTKLYDLLLVDPDVDDNGVAPSSVAAKAAAARDAFKKAPITNLPSTDPRAHLDAKIKAANAAMAKVVTSSGRIVEGFKADGPDATIVSVSSKKLNYVSGKNRKAVSVK